MSILKWIAGITLLGIVFVFGLAAFVTLLTIEKKDAYAYHDFQTIISPRSAVRPGDVVQVDNGIPTKVLCRFSEIRTTSPQDQREQYYNTWAENLGPFGDTISKMANLVRGNNSEAVTLSFATKEVTFIGSRLTADGTISDPGEFSNSECDKRMAVAMSEDTKVCTVVRSVTVPLPLGVVAVNDGSGTIQRQVVALHFKSYMNVPRQALLDLGVSEEEIAKLQEVKCNVNTLPFDVRARKKFGIVEQREVASVSQ